MPEQLAFQQAGGQGRAVDRGEGGERVVGDVDEVPSRDQSPGELRVAFVDAGVDDGQDQRGCAHVADLVEGLGSARAAEAPLIGIEGRVERSGDGVNGIVGLGVGDARIGPESREGGVEVLAVEGKARNRPVAQRPDRARAGGSGEIVPKDSGLLARDFAGHPDQHLGNRRCLGLGAGRGEDYEEEHEEGEDAERFHRATSRRRSKPANSLPVRGVRPLPLACTRQTVSPSTKNTVCPCGERRIGPSL